MTEAEKTVEAEEKRQLRPYRRLVGAIFTLVMLVASVLVLRGIIRHLDRLPSVDALYKPSVVDVRALRACADDLERLELRVRTIAGRAFSEVPLEGQPPPNWQDLAGELELERLSVVARCRLHEPSADPVVKDLETAANAIEVMLREYALLHGRHLDEGLPQSIDAQRSLKRASTALRAR